MPSPERIAKIDAMSEEEMVAQVAQGPRSAFNEESRARMEARLAQMRVRGEQQTSEVQTQQVNHAAEANVIARENNDIQRQAIGHGAENVRWAKWIAVITMVSVIVATATYLRS
jgi:hypothetical protein